MHTPPCLAFHNLSDEQEALRQANAAVVLAEELEKKVKIKDGNYQQVGYNASLDLFFSHGLSSIVQCNLLC